MSAKVREHAHKSEGTLTLACADVGRYMVRDANSRSVPVLLSVRNKWMSGYVWCLFPGVHSDSEGQNNMTVCASIIYFLRYDVLKLSSRRHKR